MTEQTAEVAKLVDLTKDIKVAMLTTVDEHGAFTARPMAQQGIEDDASLWFFTERNSHIVRDVAANPHVEGVWTWTQDGGPWRAGPMSLELKSGTWWLYELNTMLAARLARDPDAEPADITADWTRRYLTDDPQAVRAVGELMALSRSAVTHGLYIGPYANRRVRALGLEPPPMMWIFEWDIVTGDSHGEPLVGP